MRSNAVLLEKYDTGWRVTEVFPVNVLEFQTHRDAFAVSFTEAEMKQKLKELADVNISDGGFEQRYGLKSNSSWSFFPTFDPPHAKELPHPRSSPGLARLTIDGLNSAT